MGYKKNVDFDFEMNLTDKHENNEPPSYLYYNFCY